MNRGKPLALAALLASTLAADVRAAQPEAGPAPSAPTICGCAAKKVCWDLVLAAFGQISGAAKTEVEGALPGKFFPGTRANALRRADPGGHFLLVTCGPRRVPCPGYRDKLENRLAVSSFLRSLPLHPPEKELFDPITWAITPRGDGLMNETLRCRPQLWGELAPLLLQSPTP